MQFLVETKTLNFLVFFDHSKHDIHKFPEDVKMKYFDFRTDLPRISHLYKYNESEKFSDLIIKLLKEKIPAGTTLDYAIIRFDSETDVESDLYVTQSDGKKTKQSFGI